MRATGVTIGYTTDPGEGIVNRVVAPGSGWDGNGEHGTAETGSDGIRRGGTVLIDVPAGEGTGDAPEDDRADGRQPFQPRHSQPHDLPGERDGDDAFGGVGEALNAARPAG